MEGLNLPLRGVQRRPAVGTPCVLFSSSRVLYCFIFREVRCRFSSWFFVGNSAAAAAAVVFATPVAVSTALLVPMALFFGFVHFIAPLLGCGFLPENPGGISCLSARVYPLANLQGLVYRGDYMVNWSPSLQTAVSDLEVEYSEEDGKLYYFK